ncbi:putative proteasome subunit beta type-4 [Astathelohania contejeani]|uniref:Proteasome subunit beta n=1 Tax=Astathelohania contejeani TaxID=164912 RepID=A0ABQ7HZ56_9MICR|nr:putative proteasome subunit beta type-4 [Thelohania contejeani]
MDSLIGIKGKDFVLIASDMASSSSVILIKDNEDKFYEINDQLILAYSGDQGDCFRTCAFVAEKIKFDTLHNSITPTPKLVANVMQRCVHEALRKNPLKTGCLVAGKDEKEFSLYAMDIYGAIYSDKYASVGYSSYFTYGILDQEYHSDLTQEEAINIIQKCVNVMKERFVLDLSKFMVKIVTNSGIETRTIVPTQ